MISQSDLPSDNFLIDLTPYQVEVDTDGFIGNNLGEWRYGATKLRLSSEQSLPVLVDTVMHEALHAMIHVRCHQLLEKEVEEPLVAHLTAGILQIIRDNKDWIDWMYKILDTQTRRTPLC